MTIRYIGTAAVVLALLAGVDAHAQLVCTDGLVVRPGSSCDIHSTSVSFQVASDGQGCLLAGGIRLCGGNSLSYRNTVLNGERITFVASRNSNDNWTIEDVSPAPSGGGGQPPDDEDESPAGDDHGDGPLGASWLPFGYPMEGVLDSREDVDAFRFDLQGQAIVRVRARGNLDTMGTLLDSDGNIVRESDDAGGNLNFALRARIEPDTYYVLVESDHDTGAYSLLASLEREDDHGDTAEVSTQAPLGKWLSGLAEDGDDVDAFRFDLPVATDVRVMTRGPADTRGVLRDAADDVLVRAADGGNGDNFRIDRTLNAGIYYVEVSAAARGNYALRVEADDDGMSCPVPVEEPKEPEEPEEPEEPPQGEAVTGKFTQCTGSRDASGLVNVRMAGSLTAHRGVTSVRVEASANDRVVGIDFVGDMAAGDTEDWSVSGTISTSESRLSCSARVTWRERTGAPGSLTLPF